MLWFRRIRRMFHPTTPKNERESQAEAIVEVQRDAKSLGAASQAATVRVEGLLRRLGRDYADMDVRLRR